MPYISPLQSPSNATFATPIASPQGGRTPPHATIHWGQSLATRDANGDHIRRHTRSQSFDAGLIALSPPSTTQIFLQPASPSPSASPSPIDKPTVAGPVHPRSAAAALNASIEAPPPPISPKSSPSAQRLRLSPQSEMGPASATPPPTSAPEQHQLLNQGWQWPEGDPHDADSPTASTSALPPESDPVPFEPSGTQSPSRRSSPPPRLHLRGAAARSRTSPAMPISALKKSVEKLAASQRAATPVAAPMIRKKSGELVRSSLKGHTGSSSRLAALDTAVPTVTKATSTPIATREVRSKSVPATPTERKHVLFDDKLEHVKLFRSEQRPTAVSRTGSPTETETEEESEGFPFPAMTAASGRISIKCPDLQSIALADTDDRDVALEKLEMSVDQRNIRGTVQVRNMALHKRVVVRFTTDDWQTISETACEYVTAARGGSFDRWAFTIKLQDLLARIDSTRLLLVVRYNIEGRELWDNNHGRNYCLTFRREPSPVTRKQAASSVRAAQTERYKWTMGDPGDASERMAYLKRELDRLVADVDDNVSPPTLSTSSSTFANRYDFGESFKRQSGRVAPPPAMSPRNALLSNPFFHPLSGKESPSASPLPSPSLQNSNAPVAYQSAAGPAQPLYTRHEQNGVIVTDYGVPAYLLDPFPQKRPSTPPDEDSHGPYSPYHHQNETFEAVTPRAGKSSSSSAPRNLKQDYLSLLKAPRPTKGSPPADSPLSSETNSASVTPQSDGAESPPQLRDSYSDLPGLAVETRAMEGHFSPSISSADTSTSSPESPTRSDSPTSSNTSPDRAQSNSVPSYSSFLERYCWHNSSQPSALGLTDVPRQLPQPAPLRSAAPTFFVGSGSVSPEEEGHKMYNGQYQLTPVADARG